MYAIQIVLKYTFYLQVVINSIVVYKLRKKSKN